MTHGFALDEQGRKMSKSLGNGTEPQQVIDQYGADILRLWVVASDYSEDVRIGPEILKHQADVYRRLRNTLRYLLGALGGFDPAERVDAAEMPELERFVLHRLYELDELVRKSVAAFDFTALITALHNFCAVELSAFYFDVRKDALYCDAPNAPRRRAVRTTLDLVFDHLVRWLAPVLCFTAEEAWLTRHGDAPDTSVHLERYPEVPATWRNDSLGGKWARLRDFRRVVTGALELARAQKQIGSSLQGAVEIFADRSYEDAVNGVDLAELCIVSAATLSFGAAPEEAFTLPDVPGVAVVVSLAPGEKCQRCWRVLPEVGHHADHDDLCDRCSDAVDTLAARSEV